MTIKGTGRDSVCVRTFAGRAIPFLALCLSASGLVAQQPKASAAISDVTHEPRQPKPDVPVLVTVRCPEGVSKVKLRLQAVAPGKYVRKSDPAYAKDWAELAMHDDGRDGDARGGDGVFSVRAPAT